MNFVSFVVPHPAADVGGWNMRIRNLMITYFFKFFEQLVHDGHVCISAFAF
jgi:DNA gyrase/topoisomerase IV subunit B